MFCPLYKVIIEDFEHVASLSVYNMQGGVATHPILSLLSTCQVTSLDTVGWSMNTQINNLCVLKSFFT